MIEEIEEFYKVKCDLCGAQLVTKSREEWRRDAVVRCVGDTPEGGVSVRYRVWPLDLCPRCHVGSGLLETTPHYYVRRRK